jgi:ribonuclease P protein component
MRRRADFASTFRSGRRQAGPAFVLHFAAAPDADPTAPAQVGFVVSRAVGTAVVRNRTRRRLRHLLAGRLGQLPAGSRLVVRVNPAAAAMTSAALAAQLDRGLGRLLDRPVGTVLVP